MAISLSSIVLVLMTTKCVMLFLANGVAIVNLCAVMISDTFSLRLTTIKSCNMRLFCVRASIYRELEGSIRAGCDVIMMHVDLY